jgi:hypothetical protein
MHFPILLLLLYATPTDPCKGMGAVGKIARVGVRVGDDAAKTAKHLGVQTADDVVKATLKATGVTTLKRADEFLLKLVKGSDNVPTGVATLLDDIGEIPLDATLQKAIGEAMARVKGTAKGMADPIFWSDVLPHLQRLKAAKRMKLLSKSSARHMKDFEPDELIKIQYMADESIEAMWQIVDDAVEAGAKISSEGLDLAVRQTAGEIVSVAFDKAKAYISKSYGNLKKDITHNRGARDHPDVPENPPTFSVEALVAAEAAISEAAEQIKAAFARVASPQELSEKLAVYVKKGEELKEVIEESVSDAFNNAIQVDAAELITRVVEPSAADVLGRVGKTVAGLTNTQKVIGGISSFLGVGGVGGGAAAALTGGNVTTTPAPVVKEKELPIVARATVFGKSHKTVFEEEEEENPTTTTRRSNTKKTTTESTPEDEGEEEEVTTTTRRSSKKTTTTAAPTNIDPSHGFGGRRKRMSDDALDRDYGWSDESSEESPVTTPPTAPPPTSWAEYLPAPQGFIADLLFPPPVRAYLWPWEENKTQVTIVLRRFII